MLRIACPFCGPRPESEFHCAGDASRRRPPADASDAEWTDYLYWRANPKGLHRERWLHALGCGQWFIAERDTVSHDISRSEPLFALGGGDAT
ncbi:sarcosine oxidase subunit delta [Sphingopyxis sp. YF1]|uniref:sarcosine oxidase subunit delta n=1 Tax=unclassified Sphingopyxis TaxID=2614943 RepID=UPI001F60129E|nr:MULTISPECIES: sarcosine oxidase subunit delta [unclassified Sphingopyxis]UNU44642.1 sarcosine oxidase subunit delta [Sphingopyxis sp. YF1]USI76618.1 sarcosine oxidase subunit delta [Sphingopyxis sp. USTB-05]